MHETTITTPKIFYRNQKLSVDGVYIIFFVWHNLNSDVCTLNLLAQREGMRINYGLHFILSLSEYDPNCNRKSKGISDKFP